DNSGARAGEQTIQPRMTYWFLAGARGNRQHGGQRGNDEECDGASHDQASCRKATLTVRPRIESLSKVSGSETERRPRTSAVHVPKRAPRRAARSTGR